MDNMVADDNGLLSNSDNIIAISFGDLLRDKKYKISRSRLVSFIFCDNWLFKFTASI